MLHTGFVKIRQIQGYVPVLNSDPLHGSVWVENTSYVPVLSELALIVTALSELALIVVSPIWCFVVVLVSCYM